MASKIFFPANTLRPTSAFTYTVSGGGKATGSHVFECRYIDYANITITSKLQEGVRITTLDPNIPSSVDYLKIVSYTHEHQKGGITRIRVQLAGFVPSDEQSSGLEERNTSYSYRGSLSQSTILEHPNYLEQLDQRDTAKKAIAGLWFGTAFSKTLDTDVEQLDIRNKVDLKQISLLTDAVSIKWANRILAGLRYYDKPQVEWTVNQSNEGGMTDDDVDKFGQKVDEPEGNPPKPDWAEKSWWMFSGLGEEKDDDSASYSRTFTLRHEPYDAELYEY
mgnify:CR=1 FL=1|tara:strand:+ start:401 stop:1231 length:831 start_codon:yes stop_codon:yes gene_type:complete